MSKLNKNEKIIVSITLGIVLISLCVSLWLIFGDEITSTAISENSEESVQDEISLGIVTTGDMSTTIDTSGAVSVSNTEMISLPVDTVVKEIYVEEGALVKAGDILYTITNSSLQNGLKELEDELVEMLDESTSEDEYFTTKIKATGDGRVKEFVVAEGLDITELNKEYDQLAILSTGGSMLADIEDISQSTGDTLSVTIDGAIVEGIVISKDSKYTCIEIAGDEYAIGAMATVTSKDNADLGTGTLRPSEYVQIQSTDGEVVYVYVEEDEEVEQGDVLFKVTTLDKEQSEIFEIINDLYGQIAIMNEYHINNAVLSPCDGIVGTIKQNEKANVQADGEVLSIKPTTGFEIRIDVDESQLGMVNIGQSAIITFSTGEELQGEVVHIDHNAVSGNSSATFSVYVSLYESEAITTNKVLPGMTGDVNIVLNENQDAIRIPLAALFEDSEGTYILKFTGDSDIYMYEVYDIPYEQIYVEIGEISELYAECLTGLSGNEEVIMMNTATSQSNFSFGGGMMPGNMSSGNVITDSMTGTDSGNKPNGN